MDEAGYRKKHSKGTDTEYIPCMTHECTHRKVVFGVMDMGVQVGDTTYFCTHPKNPHTMNLTYWWGANAPNWCPKRKINGGYE